MPQVFLIIVNWNQKDYTLACLQSVQKLLQSGCRLSVIVVDNASGDGSVEAIGQAYPQTHMLAQSTNLGFTGGNNIGMRYALDQGADYIWILNNDTVVEPKALTMLLSACREKSVGVVGSKIYFAPGHEYHKARYSKSQIGRVLWYAGGQIDWANMYAAHRGVDEVDHGQYDQTEDTPFVTGCCLFVKRSVFETIGLFDERFYLYLEDVDFSLRAIKQGFRLLYEPRSIVWHYNAGSTSGPGNSLHEYYLTRNRLLIGSLYAPVRTKLALARESITFLFGTSAVRRRAVIDAILGRFGNRFVWKT